MSRAVSDPAIAEERGRVREPLALLRESQQFLQGKDQEYRELVAPHLVDMWIDVYVALLLLRQAEHWDYKRQVAHRFIDVMLPRVRMNREYVAHSHLTTLNP